MKKGNPQQHNRYSKQRKGEQRDSQHVQQNAGQGNACQASNPEGPGVWVLRHGVASRSWAYPACASESTRKVFCAQLSQLNWAARSKPFSRRRHLNSESSSARRITSAISSTERGSKYSR